MELTTKYICPQCKESIYKKDMITSKKQTGLYKYVCKYCGFEARLYDKDAENMHKRGVW